MPRRPNRIEFRTTALKELESLPRPIQKIAAEVINELVLTDMPLGAIKLRGRPDLRRIYVGRTHRLIYGVPGTGTVVILRIRERASVYTHLDKLRLN